MLACTVMKRSLGWDSGNGGHLCHECAVWPWASYISSLAFIDSSGIGRGWRNDLRQIIFDSFHLSNKQPNKSILHAGVGRNLGQLKWWEKDGESRNIRCVGARNLDHCIVGNEELLESRLQGSRACFCLGSFFSPSHLTCSIYSSCYGGLALSHWWKLKAYSIPTFPTCPMYTVNGSSGSGVRRIQI